MHFFKYIYLKLYNDKCLYICIYTKISKISGEHFNLFQHLASRWVFICTFNIWIQYFDEFSILSDLFMSWVCFWGHGSWMWKMWKPASRAVSTFSTCPVSQSAAQRFNPASKSRFNFSIFTGRLPACSLLGPLAETPECLEVRRVVAGAQMKPGSSSVQTLLC